MMKNTSKTAKGKRGRPKKVAVLTVPVRKVSHNTGIPAFIEPTIHDLHDELSRLDSFAYSKYNS